MKEREIGEFWDKQKSTELRLRWWQSPHIIRHYNYRICGEYLDGWNEGPLKILYNKMDGNISFERAVSVGCGTAKKEMDLIEKGFVKKFVCYELSEQRIKEGEKLAFEKGISEAIEFHCGNFFESNDNVEESYDLVFWDNSIHHMLDTKKAVYNSKRILKRGGFFFCNDYVGKNRFQWSDLELAIMNGVRLSLPDEVFTAEDRQLRRYVVRQSLTRMIETDYSEAADSENIIPAVRESFEDALIINTGGVIYHTCLNDILQNIPENSDLLNYLLQMDDEIADHGFGQYAFILAQKQ